MIYQSELAGLVQARLALNSIIDAIHERIEQGEQVEPGPITAETEEAEDDAVSRGKYTAFGEGGIQIDFSRAEVIRNPELGQLMQAVRDLSEGDTKLLVAAAKALEADRGCTTPAEEFVSNVLCEYAQRGSRVTLEDIERQIDNFKESMELVEHTLRLYRHLVREESAAVVA